MPRDRVGSGGSAGGSGNRSASKQAARGDVDQQNRAAKSDQNLAVQCCVPTGCDMGNDQESIMISTDDLHGAVRVVCNNEQCKHQYMHRECFEAWEQSVLTYLRSTGRARSWSEKQRLQNLWTKKGYDLAFKACGCKCGKGHLRKDLNWVAPPPPKIGVGTAADDKRKRNRKKNRNDRPGLCGSCPSSFGGGACGGMSANSSSSSSSNINPPQAASGSTSTSSASAVCAGRPILRLRSNSMSSTGSTSGSGSSPPSSASVAGESPISPSHLSMAMHGGARRRSSQPTTTLEYFDEKPEASSATLFFRRTDYSSFNSLPRHKINPYHIKMEEDGNCGNDETRCFVLSNLAAARLAHVQCVICECSLPIYDQYPLIDGTFFLSPRQHSTSCLPVKTDAGQMRHYMYLTAVCMGCLEGWSASLRCRFCTKKWCGNNLTLGGLYSYDLFAANPCCIERLKCGCCHKLVVLAESFFSDYSNILPCPHCGHVDYHFVKPLATYYRGLM